MKKQKTITKKKTSRTKGTQSVVVVKLQFYPDKDQIPLLKLSQEKYSDACNYLSKIVYETKNLDAMNLQRDVYKNIRYIFKLKAQHTLSAIRTVVARYKTLKSNKHKWSLIRFKGNDFDLCWNKDYSILNGAKTLSISVFNSRIKVNFESNNLRRYSKEGFGDSKIVFGTAKMVNKFGKWFLHIPMSSEVELLKVADCTKVVGCDLGINHFYVTYGSDGKTTFKRGGILKQKRAQFKNKRTELQKKQTPSARRRIKKMSGRENRYVNDLIHQMTKALVDSNPKGTVFVLEDLTGIKAATAKVRLKDRYMMVSWPFHKFRQFLTYKAVRKGQTVIVVDPKYTSQICPKCHYKDKTSRNRKKHLYSCNNCGYNSNDDKVGAMNIYQRGLKLLSEYDETMTVEQASKVKGCSVNQPHVTTA